MKIKIKNIILIALLIPIFIAIILFHVKFLAKFEYKEFMSTLQDKVYERNETNYNEIIEPFEQIFSRYYDNAGLWFAFYIITSYSVLIVTMIELIILVIIQFPKNCCGCCKKCCSIYFPINCLLNMIIYLAFAFNEKSEIDLEKDKVYSFDEEFNKEIKKNLDFMKSRKIYLIVCVFVAIIGIVGQLVIVILNMFEDYYNNNNNYITPQPQIAYNIDNFK